MSLIGLLIFALVWILVFVIIRMMMGAAGVDPKITNLVIGVLALIVLIYILEAIGLFGTGPVLRLRP